MSEQTETDYLTVEFIDDLTVEQLREGFKKLRRALFTAKIRLESETQAVKNLMEKVERLENLEIYDGLEQQEFD